jgi:hypothetical protein
MTGPEFKVIQTDAGEGVTYVCGCPCVPTARPTDDGAPGHEHCCCGKVHFVGAMAEAALAAYVAERKLRRKREPEYTVGSTFVTLAGKPVEVAWAFPVE